MGVQYCDSIEPGFCENDKAVIRVTCNDLGKLPGKRIMIRVNGKTCYCNCPAADTDQTTVLDDEGTRLPAQMAEGAEVLACGLDLEFEPTDLEHVNVFGPTRFENMVYLSYTADGEDYQRVVPMDLPLLTCGGRLIPAGRLQLDDQLVDVNGEPAPISDMIWGAYEGVLYELATSIERPNDCLDSHLLIVDGVITGDFAVQIFTPLLAHPTQSGLHPRLASRSCIGSYEWDDENDHDGRGQTVDEVIELGQGIFLPADFVTTDIPDHASSALSGDLAIGLEEDEPHEPMENQAILEAANQAINFDFSPAYPDVNFVIDWYCLNDNIYGWEEDDGTVTVVLTGGLLRVKSRDFTDDLRSLLKQLS